MTVPQRVAVLFGGSSPERDVSLESGETVASALRSRGHFVSLVDPVVKPVVDVDWNAFDCVFNALHGTYGEDGLVQSELDSLGVPYAGSSARASSLAFDKAQSKLVFARERIRTPEATTLTRADSENVRFVVAEQLGLPCVVKPTCQGSSFGVSIVAERHNLKSAFAECFRYGDVALVERFVSGEEWTVGVIDDRPLPAIRIESNRGFYDYDAKYTDDTTQFHVEAKSSEFTTNLQEISVRTCAAIGTAGIARVDMIVDDDGQPWVLEVNTIPGFTSHSLIPKAAAAVGMDLGELFESVLPVNAVKRRLAG